MLEVRDIRCDDWHWLYIDGEVTEEDGYSGYGSKSEDLVEAINLYLKNKSSGSYQEMISGIDFETWWIEDEYAESGLPQYLKDIPKEVL